MLVDPTAVHVPALLANIPDELFDLKDFERGDPISITPILSPQNYFDTVLELIEEGKPSKKASTTCLRKPASNGVRPAAACAWR